MNTFGSFVSNGNHEMLQSAREDLTTQPDHTVGSKQGLSVVQKRPNDPIVQTTVDPGKQVYLLTMQPWAKCSSCSTLGLLLLLFYFFDCAPVPMGRVRFLLYPQFNYYYVFLTMRPWGQVWFLLYPWFIIVNIFFLLVTRPKLLLARHRMT